MHKAVMIACCLLACLLLGLSRSCVAQAGYSVTGGIQDTAGHKVAGATVQMIIGKDTLNYVTADDGQYHFKAQSILVFEIWVTCSGYLPFQQQFQRKEKSFVMHIPPITLNTNYQELDPVIVSRVRPITFGEDTVTWHAGAYHIRDGAELESLLKRLPGLEVDLDGNLIAQGNKIGRVMVNGKSFFGGDVKMALRNLPVDIIDKIQVIDDYGDKARLTGVKSGDPVKVLNLVLKEDRCNGQFGHAQTGAGDHNKYAADAFLNSFAGEKQLALAGTLDNSNPAGNIFSRQFSGSYADRWDPRWKLESNINIGGDDPQLAGSSVTDNNYGNSILHQELNTSTRAHNDNGSASATITYIPDNRHTLRISPSGSFQSGRQSVVTTSNSRQADSVFTKVLQSTSLNISNSSGQVGGADLYYDQSSAHSRRRLNADLNAQVAGSRQVSENRLSSDARTDSQVIHTFQRYLLDNQLTGLNLNGQVNYFSPLGKKGFLELGYNFTHVQDHTGKSTRQTDSLHPDPVRIDSLSQDYTFHLLDQRFHAGYLLSNGHLNISASLDGQTGHISGNPSEKAIVTSYHYFNWIPALQGAYRFSRSRTLSFQFSGSPQLPSLQQLQPITDLSNPQYPVEGNPHLKSSLTQAITLTYEQSSWKPLQFFGFGMNAGYSSTHNAIIENVIHSKDSSAVLQRTTYANVNGLHTAALNYHFSLPGMIHRYLRVTVSGNVSSNRSMTLTDNARYPIGTFVISQNVHLQWLIPDFIEADWSGSYTHSRTKYGGNKTKGLHTSEMGWNWKSKYYFLHHGVFTNLINQVLTNGPMNNWQSGPLFWTSSLEWQFGQKNRAVLRVIGNNILNSGTAISQSIGPINVTRSQTSLIGRFFMISFEYKWAKSSR